MPQFTAPTPPPSHAILRRPILWGAACLIAGILAHRQVELPPGVLLVLAAALAMAALLASRRKSIACACIAAALAACGMAAARLESFHYPADHVVHYTTSQPRLAELEVRITAAPRILEKGTESRLPPRQVTQGVVERVLTRDGWVPASGKVLLSLSEPRGDLAIRQRIRVLGMLRRPREADNPGQFDWSRYYRDQRILASMTIVHRGNLAILDDPGPAMLDRLRAGARRALANGFDDRHALDHALLRAMVLGDYDPQLRDVQEDFQKTGTSHHLAISGMHVAILGMLVYGVCRVLFLAPRTAAWVGIASVVIYGAVALPSPPVIRSVLLCSAFGLGLVSRRSLDGIQLLALSVFAMLIFQPLDLYNAGFQLSFGTVLGLMLFTRPATAWLDSLRDPDMVIAARVKTRTFIQRGLDKVKRGFRDAAVAGLIAWLVSAPLIAHHFAQLNPWGIPASLALAIPVLLALIGGLLKVILSLLFPFAAPLLAIISAQPIMWMRTLVDWMAALPGNDLALPRPGGLMLAVFYGLMLLPLLPRPKLPAIWSFPMRLGPVAGVLLLLAPLGMSGPEPGTLRMTLLSVGAGQCAVVTLPSGRTLLFDAGSLTVNDLSRTCIIPALRELGVRSVDQVFISHANSDHFSAALHVIERHPRAGVYLAGQFRDHAARNASAAAMLAGLGARGIEPGTLAAGQRIELDEQTTLEVLWPPANVPLHPNDASLVLRLTCHGRSILFTGDIQQAAQSSLLRDPDRLRCDLLVAPHHGSRETTTKGFLAAAAAEVVISSNDDTLSRKQVEFSAACAGRQLLRTHEHGAITVTIGPDGTMRTATFRRPGQGPSPGNSDRR